MVDAIIIGGTIFGILCAIGAVASLFQIRRLDDENQEILRWSQTPEIQQRIRDMEARGETIEYSEHTKKMLRKARRYQ